MDSGRRGRRKANGKAYYAQFLEKTSIHGLRYLASSDLHPFEKVFWAVAIMVTMSFTGYVSYMTWSRFQNRALVVSIERNNLDWNITLPAISLCPHFKYDEMKIDKLIQDRYSKVKDKDKLKGFIKGLSSLTMSTLDSINMTVNQKEVDPRNYVDIISAVPFNLSYTLASSDPLLYNTTRLTPFMSERGLCYAYNSMTAFYTQPSYWKQRQWGFNRSIPKFKANVLDREAFYYIWELNSGYQVNWFDPSEFPQISMPPMVADLDSFGLILVNVLSIVSSPRVIQMDLSQRKCRLITESDLEFSPIYSYNLCNINCRIKMSKGLCGCVPHFYRPLDKYEVCGMKGLVCLSKFKEQIIKLREPYTNKRIECNCPQLCEEERYITLEVEATDWDLGTNLKVALNRFPVQRLKREIIFGWVDVLVAIGGIAAFCIGSSLLSLGELVYYLTLRLAIFAWRNRAVLDRQHLRRFGRRISDGFKKPVVEIRKGLRGRHQSERLQREVARRPVEQTISQEKRTSGWQSPKKAAINSHIYTNTVFQYRINRP